jgi:hypothetical protein
MMEAEPYRDLFVRQALGDPPPWRAGGSASPDIIPNGTAPGDPNRFVDDYGEDPGQALVPCAENYVYVRTKNVSDQERLGQLYLAAAPPMFVCWPDLLVPLANEDGKPYSQLKVKPGAVGVSTRAFRFTPAAAGCALGGYVFTQEHPVQLPKLTSVAALAQFLSDTHGYAQRSVAFGLPASGSYAMVAAYEQREEAATIAIKLRCTDVQGWQVGLLPVAGGSEITIPMTAVPQDSISFQSEADLPAGYASTLQLTLDPGALTPAPSASVQAEVYLVQQDPYALVPLGGHTWRAHAPSR